MTVQVIKLVLQPELVSAAEQSYVMTDSRSVNMSWCRAHSGLVTRHYFPPEGFCLKVAFLSLWGALSGERSSMFS
jgi:hypothetical protein